jgi:hypothetical protein
VNHGGTNMAEIKWMKILEEIMNEVEEEEKNE